VTGEQGHAAQGHGLFGPVPVAGVEPGLGADGRGEAVAVDDGDVLTGGSGEAGVEAAQHRQAGGGEPGGEMPEGHLGRDGGRVLDHPDLAAGQPVPQVAEPADLGVHGGVGGRRVRRPGGQRHGSGVDGQHRDIGLEPVEAATGVEDLPLVLV